MEGSQHKEGIRVTLSRAERELFSHLLGGGHVLFEDVTFGHYNLTFSKDGVIMGKYFFEIKDSN